MKKTFLSVLLIFCVLCSISIPAFAAMPVSEVVEVDIHSLTEVTKTVEYLEDGSYLVTTIKTSPTKRSRRACLKHCRAAAIPPPRRYRHSRRS